MAIFRIKKDKANHNQQIIFNLIKQIAGQGKIISVPVLFIDLMGSIEAGLFLSQLLYWSDRTKNQDGWFYKSYDQWFGEIRLSKYQVSKATTICTQNGFLKIRVKKANGNPTLHYKIDEDALKQWLVKNLTIDSEKTSLTNNIDYIHRLNKDEQPTIYQDDIFKQLDQDERQADIKWQENKRMEKNHVRTKNHTLPGHLREIALGRTTERGEQVV